MQYKMFGIITLLMWMVLFFLLSKEALLGPEMAQSGNSIHCGCNHFRDSLGMIGGPVAMVEVHEFPAHVLCCSCERQGERCRKYCLKVA